MLYIVRIKGCCRMVYLAPSRTDHANGKTATGLRGEVMTSDFNGTGASSNNDISSIRLQLYRPCACKYSHHEVQQYLHAVPPRPPPIDPTTSPLAPASQRSGPSILPRIQHLSTPPHPTTARARSCEHSTTCTQTVRHNSHPGLYHPLQQSSPQHHRTLRRIRLHRRPLPPLRRPSRLHHPFTAHGPCCTRANKRWWARHRRPGRCGQYLVSSEGGRWARAGGHVQHVGADRVPAYVSVDGTAADVSGGTRQDLASAATGSFLLCGGGSDGELA